MALNFPINPTLGQVYTVGGESWKWDGHCWGVAASADTYAPVFIGQFPPPAPIAGDLWWNSTSGKLCIYYADVDGSQWVSATQVPDIIATVDPAQVTAAFLEQLTPYATISAAVAAGINTGQLFRIDGGTTVEAIRAVASYGGSGSGDKGQKGQDGTKGQKGIDGTGTAGAKGEKGQQGTAGAAASKGQKGEVGITGSKGQKGEIGVGTKGQKGEVGVATKGQKGQDGTAGSNGSNGTNGTKGQKGQEGAAATKGQKGEVGAGTKGQKGTEGAGGGAGTKGQKGQEGSGTAAGADTEIQFNNGGAFGASSSLTWNGSVLGAPTIVSGNCVSGLVQVATAVNPDADLGADLGSAILRFANGHVNAFTAGTLTVTGNTTLGDANTDTITLTGSVNSNILPLTNNSVNFGSTTLKWNNIYGNVLHGTSLSLTGTATMSLGNFADDAAAAAGGVGVGQLYRNGSVVQIRVS